MKQTKILLICLAFLLTCLFSCEDQDCKISGGKYEFVLPFKLSPAIEVFHIDDTFRVTSTFSNLVFERVTNQNYNLKDFKFNIITAIYYMDTNIVDYRNIDFFELIIDSNYWYDIINFSDGSNVIDSEYNFKNNIYNYEFLIIPKKTGNFFLSIGSSLISQNPDQSFPGKCKNVASNAVVYMNDRQQNNAYLLLESENEYYEEFFNRLEEKYLDAGGYCFKVVE